MQPDGRQLTLALSREQKLEIVGALRNRQPPLISRIVQKNMANLVEQIELNAGAEGWCALGQEVMAAKLGIESRTYRRQIEIARELELVETMPGAGMGACGMIRVHWDVVRRRSRGEGLVEHAPLADQTDDDRPPLAVPIDGKNVRSYRTNVRSPHLPSVSRNYKNHLPSTIKDGEESLVTQTPDKCPARPDIFVLAIADLARPERVDQWCQWAFATGRARECDRHRIFAAAFSVFRRHKAAEISRQLGPGVGAFLANVRQRRWMASQIDDDWAGKALRYLDRQESGL